jgi:hypothetical protein
MSSGGIAGDGGGIGRSRGGERQYLVAQWVVLMYASDNLFCSSSMAERDFPI